MTTAQFDASHSSTDILFHQMALDLDQVDNWS